MKTVTCASGLTGWQARLHEVYDEYEEFESYSLLFALHSRLGFDTPAHAWAANPLVEGSVNPIDYRRVE